MKRRATLPSREPDRAAGPAREDDRPRAVVAIAGRPNAGKSTLFNRLLRRRRAIVADEPGVTRDENRAETVRDGRRYELVDTGGIEETAPRENLAGRVHERSLAALARADVIVHVVDGKAGLSAADRAVARRIRALGVPTVLAVNKVDRADQSARAIDFLALGDPQPVPVSAAHGLGTEDLWERIDALLPASEALPEAAPQLPEAAPQIEESGPLPGAESDDGEAAARQAQTGPPRVALVGRPNVGKSSLLNRIAGFERTHVDAVPGTTRDPIDLEVSRGQRRYVVVDTAGLRRPSRVEEGVEGHAASASLRAIERAEVVVLVLDASAGISDQDLRIADLVWRRGRGLVVAVNKADLAPELTIEQCHATIAKRLPQWPPVPLARLSALAGTGLGTLFAAIDTVAAAYRRRIPTPRLNNILRSAATAHPPALVKGRASKLLYAAQVRAAPQEVAIVASHPEGITAEYRRYLLHHVRDTFGLVGVPVKLVVRERTRRPRPAGTAPAKARPRGGGRKSLSRRRASR